MIEVGLAEILTVTGAIIGPLLIVIKVLWTERANREAEEDKNRISDRAAYDQMRDRMQDKIDGANQKASDAITTATAALNSMKEVLVSVQDTQKKQGEQWPIFKDELLLAVKNTLNGRVSP